MKVKAVKSYECPECGDFIPEEDLPKVETRYQCGKCKWLYDDRDEAEECCRE